MEETIKKVELYQPPLEQTYYYDRLQRQSVISKVMPLLNNNTLHVRADGRIGMTIDRICFDTPWVYVRPALNKLCFIWHKLYFQCYGIVYSKCQQCWKVVVRPRTLEELFELYEYQQKRYDLPCKCGTEERPIVEGIYGGYFYNESLEDGLMCLERVKAEFAGPRGMPIYLKRACTEFEQSWGDSTEWEVSDEQKALESLLDSTFVQDEFKMLQPQHLRAENFRKWIHKAVDHGDMTYLKFTNGKHLIPEIVKYFGNEKEEIPWQNIKQTQCSTLR